MVLINTGSASASEIGGCSSGPISDATIIGARKFFKGSVQTVHQITENTGVKITTARYYTPNGRAIQAKGTPDLYVEETEDGDGYNGLDT